MMMVSGTHGTVCNIGLADVEERPAHSYCCQLFQLDYVYNNCDMQASLGAELADITCM